MPSPDDVAPSTLSARITRTISATALGRRGAGGFYPRR
jgi:hypothetical protein